MTVAVVGEVKPSHLGEGVGLILLSAYERRVLRLLRRLRIRRRESSVRLRRQFHRNFMALRRCSDGAQAVLRRCSYGAHTALREHSDLHDLERGACPCLLGDARRLLRLGL